MNRPHRQLASMGTRLDIVLPTLTGSDADQVTHLIRLELERIEQKLSIYRPDSLVSLINKSAFERPVVLDEEVESILEEVFRLNHETAGYFDITLKPLIEALTLQKDTKKEDATGLLLITGMDKLEIENHSIRFKNQGIQLDFGGYGKGYAVRQILQIFETSQIKSALISFGESLVFGVGAHPYGDHWKISIPSAQDTSPPVFNLVDEGVSTSGNSLNNQKKFANSGHILDPSTLEMRSNSGLVCVKAKDPVRAEVFSTAFFAAGRERSEEIYQEQSNLEMQWLLPTINEE